MNPCPPPHIGNICGKILSRLPTNLIGSPSHRVLRCWASTVRSNLSKFLTSNELIRSPMMSSYGHPVGMRWLINLPRGVRSYISTHSKLGFSSCSTRQYPDCSLSGTSHWHRYTPTGGTFFSFWDFHPVRPGKMLGLPRNSGAHYSHLLR